METDRGVLAARIRQAHLATLPSFTTGPLDESMTTVVAEALASENITLTVTITSKRFDVEPRGSDPAARGTAVTVTVASSDTETGARRHVQRPELEAWARAVFSEVDDEGLRVYLLGGIDPDTGRPEFGLIAYRAFFDTTGRPIHVPPQLLTTPHYSIGPLH